MPLWEALRELRALLRRIVDRLVAGLRVSATDLRELNKLLAASPVERSVELRGSTFALSEAHTGALGDRVIAAIATAFARTLTEEDPSRIKVCENPDCGWVFYDKSRNRSRRWCEGPGSCGNLIKVRRFRERRGPRGVA